MEESQRSAIAVVDWLCQQTRITEVFYPGLASHPGFAIQQAQAAGPGAVLTFTVSTIELTRKLLEDLTLAAFAVSLGGVESIISYPAKMSHAAMSREERELRGISDTLIRLSVGLEDPEDLIADLDRVLNG
jgi:cystathionine beta-lyase